MPGRSFPRAGGMATVISIFLVSRTVVWLLGLEFEATTLGWFWQYIDVDLLKNNLVQSLFYLHSQPRGFNLFLGGVLKLFPTQAVLAFSTIYFVCGLILSISLFLLMCKVGISVILSVFLMCLFLINPSTTLFENWLFYTYPVVTLLCLSALCLHQYFLWIDLPIQHQGKKRLPSLYQLQTSCLLSRLCLGAPGKS